MHVGVQLPNNEVEVDRGALRELAQGIEGLGFHHAHVVDHVVGADPVTYADREYLPYDANSVVHEPLTLFGFLTACAPRLHLMTAVLVLPQRQTALVAKQAAEIDLLTEGKLRIGVGVGWNDVEYDALGMDFHTRGRRIEEQVELLRKLWTEPVVTFEGEFERVRGVSVNPLPVQQPIPIWFGG
ncbi:MAG: Luciferase-like monooxygenase, partial [Acidimicrobiaceae bacterium]|nr:Luciferase-like monooxygenase [Acidimicrobiaceae bacterium]